MKKLRNLISEEKGSVMVIVAGSLVVLMGFAALVVDVGLLYLERARLMDTADAAALAGAQELYLSEAQAKAVAEEYVVKNGEELKNEGNSQGFTVFVGQDPEGPYPDETVVRVTANTEVDFFFARVLGHYAGDVGARAVATARTAALGTKVVPIGISKDQPRVNNELCTLKVNKQNDDLGNLGSGNFGALDLDGEKGGGANDYRERIKNGYEGTLRIGDEASVIIPESGNMVGPTDQGLQSRLKGCTHSPKCTIAGYVNGCPRIVIVPVYEVFEMQNKNKVKSMKVVGFAAFLLSDSSDSGEIQGYFLEGYTISGDSDPNATNYGTYTVKLIE